VVNGDSGDDELHGGNGNDGVVGGDGRDTLEGGFGDDALAGGQGADRFMIGQGLGRDTITDFDGISAAHDTLVFDRTLFDSLSSVLSASLQIRSDLRIVAGPTDVLIVKNTQLASLTAANGSFV
jgi:Ca2+-binding RTX toxin-like protein